jgi:hypothetical protein
MTVDKDQHTAIAQTKRIGFSTLEPMNLTLLARHNPKEKRGWPKETDADRSRAHGSNHAFRLYSCQSSSHLLVKSGSDSASESNCSRLLDLSLSKVRSWPGRVHPLSSVGQDWEEDEIKWRIMENMESNLIRRSNRNSWRAFLWPSTRRSTFFFCKT